MEVRAMEGKYSASFSSIYPCTSVRQAEQEAALKFLRSPPSWLYDVETEVRQLIAETAKPSIKLLMKEEKEKAGTW